jgi:hypothetical protein
MLFENDGSFSDALNYACEMVGDGAVMDAFRAKMSAEWVSKQEEERRAILRLARKVKLWKIRRRILGDHGVTPDFECPACHYHGYAAGAKLLALDRGVPLDCNGYGIWDDDDFVAWYKRKYPELCYEEAPRNARILVNEQGKLPAAPLPILMAS